MVPQNHNTGEEGVRLDIYKASQTIQSIDENTVLLELNKPFEKRFHFSVKLVFNIVMIPLNIFVPFYLVRGGFDPPSYCLFFGSGDQILHPNLYMHEIKMDCGIKADVRICITWGCMHACKFCHFMHTL